MSKLNWNASGFLNEAPYRMHFKSILDEYVDKFGDAETIEVSLREIPYTMLGYPPTDAIIISEDGRSVIINFTDFKFYDKNGKVKSLPSPESVFNNLRGLMNSAVNKYSKYKI